jgi:hypothetical protein
VTDREEERRKYELGHGVLSLSRNTGASGRFDGAGIDTGSHAKHCPNGCLELPAKCQRKLCVRDQVAPDRAERKVDHGQRCSFDGCARRVSEKAPRQVGDCLLERAIQLLQGPEQSRRAHVAQEIFSPKRDQ